MLNLLVVEVWRAFITAARYPVNFFTGLFLHTFTFYAIFLGAQFMSGQSSFGDNLNAMTVGYAAWVLVLRNFGKTPRHIEAEAATGVLESVFMSSHTTSILFLFRAFAEAIIDLSLTIMMIVVLMYLTGAELSFPWQIALPTLTLTLAAIGIGMIAGGLALQFKRITALLQPIQIGLIFFMFAPFEQWTTGLQAGLASLAMWFPMVPSVVLLREMMAYDIAFDHVLAIKAVLNGVGWVTLGTLLFHGMTNRAREKGIVGGY